MDDLRLCPIIGVDILYVRFIFLAKLYRFLHVCSIKCSDNVRGREKDNLSGKFTEMADRVFYTRGYERGLVFTQVSGIFFLSDHEKERWGCVKGYVFEWEMSDHDGDGFF